MSRAHTVVKVFATSSMGDQGAIVAAELKKLIEAESSEHEVVVGHHKVSRFSNDNLEVQVENVRDHIAFVFHTQAPPVADGVVELLATLDAINNAHPRQTYVAFPYMPYSRSDRKDKPRISVMGQRLPEILNQVLRVRRVLLFEPHNAHIKQYFNPTADEVPAVPLLVDHIRSVIMAGQSREDFTLVFADAGAAKRFEEVPAILGIDPTYIYKYRPDNSEAPQIKGIAGKFEGRHCIVLDDEVLTGGTVFKDAELLKSKGALTVKVLAVHGILADKRLNDRELMERFDQSPVDEFVLTDTVPLAHKVALAPRKFTILPIAPLLAEASMRLILGHSLSELHSLDAHPAHRRGSAVTRA
jgi:ribose-phosphate pyrophosphokinase